MNSSYFNTGIYTLRDASRLTRVSTGRIRRWLRGYRYRSWKKAYASPPLWQGQWPPIDHTLALGFLDLIEIVRRQQVFTQIIKPFVKELEFAEDSGLVRWWPLGEKRQVVLDPTRNFGRPIVARHGVPTEVLANAAEATGSVAEVARWYEVAEVAIEDAVEFEQRLAA